MRTSISFDALADIYDETRGGVARGRNYAQTISALLDPGAPVLELGVGTGAVGLGLRELGHPITGVDLSAKMLAKAFDRLGPVVAVGDATRLPIGDQRVDTVLCVWVLQLVSDVRQVLDEVARVLRPGGALLVVSARPTFKDDDIHSVTVDFNAVLRGPRPDLPDALEPEAERAGFRLRTTTTTQDGEWEQSPEGEARRLEARAYGPLIDLDDETFERVVRPVIDALRALPEPDRPRVRSTSHPLLVFDRT